MPPFSTQRMHLHRAILSLTLALCWCAAAWHGDLEAAGLMFDHDHHHAATPHDHADHTHDAPDSALGTDEHDPMWARHGLRDAVIAFAGPMLLGLVCLVALVLTAQDFSSRLGTVCAAVRQRPPDDAVIWQFVQRCAPRAAAPPRLS